MTPEEIAAFFAGHRRAYDNRDAVALAAYYAEECVVESPIGGNIVGRDAVERVARLGFAAFPDFKIEHEDLLTIGDRVVETATVSGTDTHGFMGLPPTGKHFRAPSVFLFTLKGRQIIHERRSYDFSGFLLQLAGEMRPAFESARLYRDTLERAQLENDVKIAAEIQRALAPHPRHRGKNFEVAAASTPCRAIGGDFFDYFDLTSGGFGLALGDVSGKGPPAALLAAMLQGIFAVHAYAGEPPAVVLRNVNHALMRREIEGQFATVFYGVLSPNGQFTYCNAGHNPPILIGSNATRRLESGGLILGAFKDAEFAEATVQLSPGDTLIAFSDGMTEAEHGDGSFGDSVGDSFGDDRLLSCIQSAPSLDPPALLQRLFEAIRQFTGGAPQSDDMTAMVLRFFGP
ncbi:MAG: PP2C family protein-serine/threonine phosphatase [Candidatus Acidiferrales bacterium]